MQISFIGFMASAISHNVVNPNRADDPKSVLNEFQHRRVLVGSASLALHSKEFSSASWLILALRKLQMPGTFSNRYGISSTKDDTIKLRCA